MKQESRLWENILDQNHIELEMGAHKNFRRPGGVNSRFASWEPKELSLRWYRTFLNLAFNTANDWVKESYQKFHKQMNYGDPIVNVISHNGKSFPINLDYLITFEEIRYLTDFSLSTDLKRVIEIGAGFGRLPHVFLLVYCDIEEYLVVDLPPVLKLSQEYLHHVLPSKLFKKLRFMKPSEIGQISGDLAIQIDGLNEMEKPIIDFYYTLFNRCTYFYSKQVVAKYLPKHAGLPKQSFIPLELGRSRTIMDIWNVGSLSRIYNKHVKAYTPNSHWLLNSTPCRLFPHYLQIISKKIP